MRGQQLGLEVASLCTPENENPRSVKCLCRPCSHHHLRLSSGDRDLRLPFPLPRSMLILPFVGSSSNGLSITCLRRPMYWREITEADLSKCLEIQPACLGDQIVGRSTALRVWKGFLDNPAFHANVI